MAEFPERHKLLLMNMALIGLAPKLVKDKKMREFLRMLTKLSCPPSHTNADQPWQVFNKNARQYVDSIQPPPKRKTKSSKST